LEIKLIWKRKLVYVSVFIPFLLWGIYWAVFCEIILWGNTLTQSLESAWLSWITIIAALITIGWICVQPETELEKMDKKKQKR
jgi:hypothetical protein